MCVHRKMFASKVSLRVTFKITGNLKGCTEQYRKNLTKTSKKWQKFCLDQYFLGESNEKQKIPDCQQFQNQIDKQKYQTVRTVPKSNRQTKIPDCQNSSKIQ